MCTDPSCRHRNKRRLRPLVISLIPKDGDVNTSTSSNNTLRREQITQMFTTYPSLSKHFEAPTFSQGVPSRELRGRLNFLQHANNAGLIPDIEWELICKGIDEQIEDITAKDNGEDTNENEKQHKTIDPFRYLATETLIQPTNTQDTTTKHKKKKKHWLQYETKTLVAISPNRRGAAEDIAIPYSMELWRKAKTLNRDRSVLACTFAHLMAMKILVGDKKNGALNDDNDDLEYDFILEDNVRAFTGIDNDDTKYGCECANRIWDIIEASNNASSECHLRYFGWLGSLPNLNWVYNNHMRRSQLNKTTIQDDECIIFPFPTNDDFLLDSIDATSKVNNQDDKGKDDGQSSSMPQFSTPGGTAVWGTFAYTISPSCYHTLVETLQNDVGQLMWKGKRMRAYQSKPIDKILPRHVKTEFSPFNIHIPKKVAFVRAPMLGSLLHPQWEEGFCSSTELQYQLSCGKQDGNENSKEDSSVWDNVWLTQEEREVVSHRKKTGRWIQKGDIIKTERSRNSKSLGVSGVLPLTIMMISFLSLVLSDAFVFNSQSIYCGCNVRYKSRSIVLHTQLESEDATLNIERKRAKLGKVPIISRTILLEVKIEEETKKMNVTVWEMDKPSDLIQEWWSIDDSERKSRVGDPFGVVMWPGSIVASNELLKKHYSAQVSPFENATVLVLGAGTGVEAQTATLLGASKVVATDISPLTLKLLEHGAEEETRIDNSFEARHFDLFSDEVLPECDILIAADVLYNPELASQVGRRLHEAIVRSFEEGLPPTKIICTDSQQFHGTNFLNEVAELQELNNMFIENSWEHLKWEAHKLNNVRASGVLVDDDQVYDVNVRMICWGW